MRSMWLVGGRQWRSLLKLSVPLLIILSLLPVLVMSYANVGLEDDTVHVPFPPLSSRIPGASSRVHLPFMAVKLLISQNSIFTKAPAMTLNLSALSGYRCTNLSGPGAPRCLKKSKTYSLPITLVHSHINHTATGNWISSVICCYTQRQSSHTSLPYFQDLPPTLCPKLCKLFFPPPTLSSLLPLKQSFNAQSIRFLLTPWNKHCPQVEPPFAHSSHHESIRLGYLTTCSITADSKKQNWHQGNSLWPWVDLWNSHSNERAEERCGKAGSSNRLSRHTNLLASWTNPVTARLQVTSQDKT